MAWRRPGDKPLSEPMMVNYWRKYASLGLNELISLNDEDCRLFEHLFILISTLFINFDFDVFRSFFATNTRTSHTHTSPVHHYDYHSWISVVVLDTLLIMYPGGYGLSVCCYCLALVFLVHANLRMQEVKEKTNDTENIPTTSCQNIAPFSALRRLPSYERNPPASYGAAN